MGRKYEIASLMKIAELDSPQKIAERILRMEDELLELRNSEHLEEQLIFILDEALTTMERAQSERRRSDRKRRMDLLETEIVADEDRLGTALAKREERLRPLKELHHKIVNNAA